MKTNMVIIFPGTLVLYGSIVHAFIEEYVLKYLEENSRSRLRIVSYCDWGVGRHSNKESSDGKGQPGPYKSSFIISDNVCRFRMSWSTPYRTGVLLTRCCRLISDWMNYTHNRTHVTYTPSCIHILITNNIFHLLIATVINNHNSLCIIKPINNLIWSFSTLYTIRRHTSSSLYSSQKP